MIDSYPAFLPLLIFMSTFVFFSGSAINAYNTKQREFKKKKKKLIVFLIRFWCFSVVDKLRCERKYSNQVLLFVYIVLL